MTSGCAVQMDDDELLQMHLDAKDNLRSAYAMLNEQYSAPQAKSLSMDALSELESAGQKKHSDSLKSDDDHKGLHGTHGTHTTHDDNLGAAPVQMLTHVRLDAHLHIDCAPQCLPA
jgi:hypothetical protein